MTMQPDGSSGCACSRSSMEPTISDGDQTGNGFHEHHHESVVTGAIEPAAEPQQPRTPKRPAGGSGRRSSSAEGMRRAESLRSVHPEFRTDVAVAELTVTGVLPATARPQEGGTVAISGDVRRLSSDRALELADALLLVVARMDVVLEKRYGATINATRDRED